MLLKTQLTRVKSRFDEIIAARTSAFAQTITAPKTDDLVKAYFRKHKTELADIILAGRNLTDRYGIVTSIQSHPVVMEAEIEAQKAQAETHSKVEAFRQALRIKADELLDQLYLGETDAIGKIKELQDFAP